jgi:demethylmenaquinone methyltransferase/2-methoxy-6-polyprenyl-1,4-benzoquinol methylase
LPVFDEHFLREQLRYYCARAPEYDEWWERRGRYDHGPAENAAWFVERAEAETALLALGRGRTGLDLACGTGNWTRPLLQLCDRVVAVDGSEEMLAIHRARLPDPRIERRRMELFTWEPDTAYDRVLFAFWISHVPPERVLPFLGRVRRSLSPDGCFFLVDSRADPFTTTADQPLPRAGEPVAGRRLNDGREFSVVKVFYEVERLGALLAAAGLTAEVRVTPRFFIYAWGRPS